jgi:hypothetical protein
LKTLLALHGGDGNQDMKKIEIRNVFESTFDPTATESTYPIQNANGDAMISPDNWCNCEKHVVMNFETLYEQIFTPYNTMAASIQLTSIQPLMMGMVEYKIQQVITVVAETTVTVYDKTHTDKPLRP